MLYKSITKESYQATAEEFSHKVADLAPMGSIERFSKLLPPKANIIDIGCGSGRDAKIFSDNGFHVLGIDYSSNLIDIAQRHAPLAEFHIMDIEEMAFNPSSFDGAWAAHSLCHIPKNNILHVLETIHTLLKEGGYFSMTVKEGSNEVLEKDARYGDYEKFWSYYELEELKQLLQAAKFKILECNIVEKQAAYLTHNAIRAFCQK